MDVLMVAACGVALVLTSILLLRLHPLLGLLLGSLFVLAATPRAVLLSQEQPDRQIDVVYVGEEGLIGTLSPTAEPGSYYVVSELQQEDPPLAVELQPVSGERLQAAIDRRQLSSEKMTWFQTDRGPTAMAAGARLISVETVRAFDAERWEQMGGKLADGFAKTFRKLGIPVTMAAIVGVCLLESGAAARLVSAILKLFGPRGTSPALAVSGFILGVPVFFDNVFYLLLPLAKAVGRQRPASYLAAAMAIIVGATMAHSLVPPTPGPLLVAAALQVNVGLMMLGGLVVGGMAACVGFAYGMLCSRWFSLPLDVQSESTDAVERMNRPIPLWLAALPIAVPMVLLAGAEVINVVGVSQTPTAGWAALKRWSVVLSDPGLIFIGTALISIALLRCYTNRETVGKAVARGIADAGTIVLLTCAGGAFGAALQQLDLASAIGQRFAGLTTPWGMLLTAFFLTTIIRAAQGSATVAMITSAAIVAPVAESIELPFHVLYLALAIGCGSKPLPWMNDSGFWQVATMTGMTTAQTLKTFSVALTLMGISGFAITLLGAWLLPLT